MRNTFVIRKDYKEYYRVRLYDDFEGGVTHFELLYGKEYPHMVGRAYLYYIENGDIIEDRIYGLIEDIHIKKEHRGKRLGNDIVRLMIDKAKDYGCYKVIATSRFEREYVHKFYEDLGLKKWGYEFRIDLE